MKKSLDIVILCSPLMADWISKTFEMQIADQRLPASVIWSGQSSRYGQGVVIIQWKGEALAHFTRQLEIDSDVIDYLIYQLPEIEEV